MSRRFALALMASSATTTLSAAPLELSKPDDDAPIRSALSRAENARIGSPVLFDDQSFRLRREGKPVGVLVSGRGMRRVDKTETSVCFAALVTTGTQVQLVETIGAGEWEAESCTKPVAVGAIDASRIVIVYQAASPNAGTLEPVVLNVGHSGLSLDLAASRKASLAGATTISQTRDALRRGTR